MVWIHGGGFQAGAGAEPRHDGEALRREGRRPRDGQLPARRLRVPRAPGAHARVRRTAPRATTACSTRSPRCEWVKDEHRGVRRRSRQRDDLRRVGRIVFGERADGLAAGEGSVPQGDRRERRLSRRRERDAGAAVAGGDRRTRDEVRLDHWRAIARGAPREAERGGARRRRIEDQPWFAPNHRRLRAARGRARDLCRRQAGARAAARRLECRRSPRRASCWPRTEAHSAELR